jgi:ADP-ribosylation factor GTPase-activating protein 1
MDSWTEAQLAQMKLGGNDKCNAYLQQHGIDPRTPIKQKYESPFAQLYKLQLKARAEGKPIPTELPVVAPRSGNNHMPSSHSHNSSSSSAGDPQSMERLPGESEQQYVARQTRLREEARARMAAKFGNSGGSMGGMGSSGMQGIGSDPSYNPRAGGYSSGSNNDVLQTFSSGLGAALGVAGSYAGSVAAKLQSEDTLQSVKTVGSSFWGTLTSSVSTVAATLTTDEDDGLSDLQRQFASQKPTQSKYAGFGSGATTSSNFGAPAAHNPAPSFASTVQEAPGLPGEDRNGVERLTGESDEQYVVRQTRLRDEARARMAAKFGGGGGLSSVASSPPPSSRPTPPPSLTKPPSSGNSNNVNATDFFSSFGA